MEKKISDILHIIKEEGNNISQRTLADKSGYSLGTINKLLKKCAKKGLLEMKKINRQKFKYLLTRQGMKVATRKTLNYVRDSYRVISGLKEVIHEHTREKFPEKKVVVLKNEETKYQEVWQLVKAILEELKIDFAVYNSVEEVKKEEIEDNPLLFYWNSDLEGPLQELPVNSVNLVQSLKIG